MCVRRGGRGEDGCEEGWKGRERRGVGGRGEEGEGEERMV